MEEEEDMPLFWAQTTDTHPHRRRLRRQASSVFLNSGVFLIVLLVVAFTFVFVIVPSIGSLTSQILRPHSIKKSWDSLNLVLVLFAIICGFLSRNNNSNDSSSNESSSYYEDQSLLNVQKSYPSPPSHRWFDQYQDRTHVSYNTLNRLRSSSSYPDLRQESFERWRFYDDTHLNNYRSSTSNDRIHHHPQQQQHEEETKKEQEEVVVTKATDVVDVFVIDQKELSYPSSPPPCPPLQPSPPSPPSPPPPKLVRRKVKRTYQDLGYERRTDHEEKYFDQNFYIPPPSQLPPQPPPPPPPPPMFSKNEKRRGKDFLISLRRKLKKQRQKSVESLDTLFKPDQPSTSISILSLIPPPPPQPPPHFFQNLFSPKKGKTKKLHPVPPPPPPPPPPVTSVSKVVSRKVTSRTKVQVAPVPSRKPPKPVKTSSFHGMEENVESGNASPLIPMPPPPPPPPFKMTAMKFALDGDYVRVGSFNSSRSASPDLDSTVEDATSEKDQPSPMAAGGGDSASMPLFCPSPDVNTKADNFIARFRAGLKLEKVSSVKGRSNLGPEASTS